MEVLQWQQSGMVQTGSQVFVTAFKVVLGLHPQQVVLSQHEVQSGTSAKQFGTHLPLMRVEILLQMHEVVEVQYKQF